MTEKELETMTSQQLDELLKAELAKECVDRGKVLRIMRVLEEREAGDPDVSPVDVQAIWEEFQENRERTPVRKRPRRWLGMAAAAVAVVIMFAFVVPPAMGAENIFTLFGKWTEDVFAFFNPYKDNAQQEYVFRTDHPGLQQVYDAVVEMGVTEPVVPTWVPDGYELMSVDVVPVPVGTRVYARMNNGDKMLTIGISNVTELSENQYSKDDAGVVAYEAAGINHFILQNEEKCVAIWVSNGVECSISAYCGIDTILEIVDSIYGEVNE